MKVLPEADLLGVQERYEQQGTIVKEGVIRRRDRPAETGLLRPARLPLSKVTGLSNEIPMKAHFVAAGARGDGSSEARRKRVYTGLSQPAASRTALILWRSSKC